MVFVYVDISKTKRQSVYEKKQTWLEISDIFVVETRNGKNSNYLWIVEIGFINNRIKIE